MMMRRREEEEDEEKEGKIYFMMHAGLGTVLRHFNNLVR